MKFGLFCAGRARLALPLVVLALAANASAQSSMSVSSASIVDGRIGRVHACASQGGSDRPLQLSVKDVPSEARYIAVVGDDPDAVRPAGKVWVHWNLFNIPASSNMTIAPGEMPGGEAGRTSGNAKGYEGMCPPDGTHTYRFAVFALKDKIEAGGFFGPSPLTIDEFESKYGGQILAKDIITGKF